MQEPLLSLYAVRSQDSQPPGVDTNRGRQGTGGKNVTRVGLAFTPEYSSHEFMFSAVSEPQSLQWYYQSAVFLYN